MSSHAAVTWKVVEGLEGLSANRPRVWDATLQTLHCPASGLRPMEGLEGLQVNRPHARSEKLQTFQTVHCIPWPVAYPVARMTAIADLSRADNTADLITAASRCHELARSKAIRAVRELDAAGTTVTFESVARAAGVSPSLLSVMRAPRALPAIRPPPARRRAGPTRDEPARSRSPLPPSHLDDTSL
jgi:hypothetical protein